MIRKLLIYTAIPILIAGATACVSAIKATTEYAVPAIKVTEGAVKAARPISDSEEYYLGRSVAANILSQYDLDTDEDLRAYVNLIGQTLSLHSEKQETFGGYHFAILDTPEVNAMACPGGTIFITRGMVDLTENEDELAAVLAHEIGHVSHRDGVNTIKSARWTQALAILGSAAAQAYGSEEFGQLVEMFEGSVNDVMQTLVTNGYGRTQEYEADKTAISTLTRAGYDPAALQRVLMAFKTKSVATDTGFLKTHPDNQDRLDEIRERLADLDHPPETRTVRTRRFLAEIRPAR